MEPEKWLVLSALMGFLLASAIPVPALTGDIELFYPANESWTNQTNDTLPFIFEYTDPDNATAVCDLFINSAAFAKESVLADNGTQEGMYSSEDFNTGANSWWITCTNGSSITSATRTFFSDRNPPEVDLISPSNQSSAQSPVEFTFKYTDSLSSYAYCTLFVNETAKGTDNVLKNTEVSWDVSLSKGNYNWDVACNDKAGNMGNSGTFFLDVLSLFAVSIISPENKTYGYKDNLPLIFMVSGTPEWMGYSLDGAANVTVSDNTTFDVETECQHVIEVYANDSLGDLGYDFAYFTVSLSHEISFLSPLESIYDKDRVDVNITIDKDVVWCGFSLDGGSNISMTRESARSWFYNLTDLSDGNHEIAAWCNDSYGSWTMNSRTFTVMLSGFNIDLQTPANKTYWNTTAMDVLITLARNASMCEFYLDSEGPMLMYDISPNRWYYNFTRIYAGSFKLEVTCNDSLGFSNSTSVAFTIKSAECDTNETGICTGAQQCVDGRCVDMVCSGCRYAANHTCHAYECCSNQDCLQEQECSEHSCVDVECECGVIQDHSCVKYECCSNFDCGANQLCDLSTHKCVGRTMLIMAPPSAVAGETFKVTVITQEGDPIEGATLTIEYASGDKKTLTTDNEGVVSVLAQESGTMQITVTMAGYDARTVSTLVAAGFNWWLVIVILLFLAAAGGGFFYWQQLPPVGLMKAVSGQNVTLKVKNRSGEPMENVLIIDAVPTGAFVGCNVTPRIETYGNEDHITWFAALNPGEEIIINYQAMQTSDRFLVRIGEEEYQSGYGFMSILQEIVEKLLPKKKNVMASGA